MSRHAPQQLIQALQAKGALNPCERCGRAGFEVLGEGMQPLTSQASIPVIVVACRHCAHLVWHATRPLLEA